MPLVRFEGASVVASEYALVAKDPLLKDWIATINNAMSQGDRNALAVISAGHIAYIKAMDLYEKYEAVAARDGFQAAWSDLQKGKSPFGFWALFFVAACDYQASRYDEALAILSRIEREAPSSYGTILGRLCWLRGLILYVQAQPILAQASYWQAFKHFEATGEIEFQSAVHHLLSEVDFFLGNRDAAWRHLSCASLGSPTIRDPSRRLHTILQGAAFIALRDSMPQAALHFQEEAVRVAERSGHLAQIALALKERATISSQLGSLDSALADLERAKQMTASVRDERLLAEILLAQSKILATVNGSDSSAFSVRCPSLAEENEVPGEVEPLLSRSRRSLPASRQLGSGRVGLRCGYCRDRAHAR